MMPAPIKPYRIIITMFVPGSGTWEFRSEALDDTFAKVLLWSLSNGGPFTIQKARKVKDE
jgi:hypothetical protein